MMDNIFVNKSSQRKVSRPVLILAIVSLIFNVMCFISSFFEYDFYYVSYLYTSKTLRFRFPEFFELIGLLALVSASLLLLIYFLKFYSCGKKKVLLTVALGLSALFIIFDLLFAYLFAIGNILSGLIVIFFYFAFSVLIILAAIFWQKGKFNKKAFIITSIVLFSVHTLIYLVYIVSSFGWYIENRMHFYIIKYFFYLIGMTCLLLTPFIFFLKDAIPDLKKQEIAPSMPSIEEELIMLNEKFALGIITEEEYNLLRADIIQRL